jgi:hypothetical protein
MTTHHTAITPIVALLLKSTKMYATTIISSLQAASMDSVSRVDNETYINKINNTADSIMCAVLSSGIIDTGTANTTDTTLRSGLRNALSINGRAVIITTTVMKCIHMLFIRACC